MCACMFVCVRARECHTCNICGVVVCCSVLQCVAVFCSVLCACACVSHIRHMCQIIKCM